MTKPPNTETSEGYSAFAGQRLLARGALTDVVRAVHRWDGPAPLVLEDDTGRLVELDLRGSLDESLARVASAPEPKASRGRPKLGVTAREITLMPRQWEWLAAQPGGASATVRRLVDAARRDTAPLEEDRRAREALYKIMTVLAGDLPGYEEVTRAFFAGDFERLTALVAAWPVDVRGYLQSLMARIDARPGRTIL